MAVQEEFISINTAPDVVERYLTKPELLARWRSPLITLEPVEGELFALNSVHRMRLKTLFLAGATYKVVERDNQHILMTIEGFWEGTDLWRWFADGSRTVVQNRVDFTMSNQALRVFAVNLGTLFSRLDMQIQMQKLQQVIEQDEPQAKATV